MKRIILILIGLVPLLSSAQEKIYQVSEWKRGIYKTYEEFINNAPSISNEFTVTETGSFGSMNGKDPYDFKVNDGSKVGKIYGFCDGKAVYVKGSARLTGGYVKVDYVGRYSFFNYVFRGVGFAAMVAPDQLTVIVEGGRRKDATVGFVSKLIRSKNSTLADEFDKLKDKRSRRIEYLIKLNEVLKSI
jgi:hypothetical protein